VEFVKDQNGLRQMLQHRAPVAPGRAGGCPPAPPQTRTSPIRASGSSADGFATCPALSVGLSGHALPTSECRRVAPTRFRYHRLLPSLLPGSLGLVRRLSVGTMKQIRLPRALLPPLGSSPCGAIPWVGLTVSLLEAGRPTASRPGCCSAGSSCPAFGPKDAIGSPKFPANPSDLCRALGPRSAPRARSLRRSDVALAIATAKAPTRYDFRGSIPRLKPSLFTLRAVLTDDYAKLASGG